MNLKLNTYQKLLFVLLFMTVRDLREILPFAFQNRKDSVHILAGIIMVIAGHPILGVFFQSIGFCLLFRQTIAKKIREVMLAQDLGRIGPKIYRVGGKSVKIMPKGYERPSWLKRSDIHEKRKEQPRE